MEYGVAPPPTAPPRRKPFDLTLLPPEMQAQLAGGTPLGLNDGSTVYPDGTIEEPPAFTGGWDNALGMAPQTEPPPEMMGGPMAGPQFDRYFNTANAGMPSSAGGALGQPIANPMQSPGFPDPFAPATEPQEPAVNLQVEGPRVEGFGAQAETGPGRPEIGRRRRGLSARVGSRPMAGGRRR